MRSVFHTVWRWTGWAAVMMMLMTLFVRCWRMLVSPTSVGLSDVYFEQRSKNGTLHRVCRPMGVFSGFFSPSVSSFSTSSSTSCFFPPFSFRRGFLWASLVFFPLILTLFSPRPFSPPILLLLLSQPRDRELISQ